MTEDDFVRALGLTALATLLFFLGVSMFLGWIKI